MENQWAETLGKEEGEKLRYREQMILYENNLDSSEDSIHQYEEYDD